MSQNDSNSDSSRDSSSDTTLEEKKPDFIDNLLQKYPIKV